MQFLNDVLLLLTAADVDAWTDATEAVAMAPLAHLWTVLAESRVAHRSET